MMEDTDDALKNLRDLLNRSDKMFSYALTGAAFEIMSRTRQKLPDWLDMNRGQRFITGSVLYKRSTPATMTSTVGFHERLTFAPLMADGGIRYPQRKKIAVKIDERQKKVSDALNRSNTFTGTVNGLSGIWKRVGKRGSEGLNLLFAFKERTTYKRGTLPFLEFVRGIASDVLAEKVRQEVERSL